MNRIIWSLSPFIHEGIYKITGWRLTRQSKENKTIGYKWIKQRIPTKW